MIRKILIVEDEQDILELLIEVLRDLQDCVIFRASDGETALRIARANIPDVILLDAHLPVLDGFELCKIVKSDALMTNIKVLMLSGLAKSFDGRKVQQAGADGYISKPFNSIALVEKIKELLKS